MRDEIKKLLSQTAPLKAKEIARELALDKNHVNAFLYKNEDAFQKDSAHRWSLASDPEIVLTLPDNWVDADDFENLLRQGGARLENPSQAIRICYPSPQCKTMIDCTARLLALANQLAVRGNKVTCDLTNAHRTHTYLNRAGFFDLVHHDVAFLPARPTRSAAKQYQGRSNTLVEFGVVDLASNEKRLALISQLTETFVKLSTPAYQVAAFTVFSELIQNVAEHSKSALRGFAGLQSYGGSRPHIKTVVSDSGVGIAHTLRPALKKHYPHLFEKFGVASLESDIGIVTEAMKVGGISRFGGAKGRGLGFTSSREQAMKFNAELSVRQEEFCLRFQYRDGNLVKIAEQRPVSKLLGTHICFDFYLPQSSSIS